MPTQQSIPIPKQGNSPRTRRRRRLAPSARLQRASDTLSTARTLGRELAQLKEELRQSGGRVPAMLTPGRRQRSIINDRLRRNDLSPSDDDGTLVFMEIRKYWGHRLYQQHGTSAQPLAPTTSRERTRSKHLNAWQRHRNCIVTRFLSCDERRHRPSRWPPSREICRKINS